MEIPFPEPPNDLKRSSRALLDGEIDQRSVSSLVLGARQRETAAWTSIFERFEPLVRSIARRYRLSSVDTEDVTQNVWLKLLESIGELRNPAALPGWIAVITANECKRELKRLRRRVDVDPGWAELIDQWGCSGGTVPDEDLPEEVVLRDEGRRSIREGLAELSPKQQELLLLLFADPPVPYAQISRRLGMPVGTIGPSKARYLKRLRETNAVRTVVEPTVAGPPGGKTERGRVA